MLPLCYKAAPPRQEFMCNLIANMGQTTPEAARKRIMIGDQQECLDTIERYTSGRCHPLHLHDLRPVLP